MKRHMGTEPTEKLVHVWTGLCAKVAGRSGVEAAKDWKQCKCPPVGVGGGGGGGVS